ncbi:MAG: outer membrane protein assembly factor BamA [Spirochaetaceae bacterium]|jgi:outer membrane protein insertion porin family|nr:outer membrane protein assembly factor BamA [Spirochaetaceae bacterium]
MTGCKALLRFFLFFLPSLTLSAGFCFAQAPDWYQGKNIKDIRFEGLRHVRLAELDDTIESYRGKPFTDTLFQELQSKLYALEYFELLSPVTIPSDEEGSEVILLFRVVERPTVSKISFVGNTGVRQRELLGAISTKINDVANSMIIRADETAVYNKYQERGFPDVQVRSEIIEAKNSTVEVVFYVTEGEKITVTQIYFEGNRIFSNSTLKRHLLMKSKGIGPGRSGNFQEAKLIADSELLARFYHDRGYLDAEVTDVVQEISKDSKGNNSMSITYRLYEGRIYIFNGISFEGNDIFSDEELQKLIRSKPGEIADATKIERDLQAVVNLYYENGYIYNSISRNETRNEEDGLASFSLSIVERGRAHIENIIIRGNKKTKDFVILREIPLEPGDVYSNTKIGIGYRNLSNLQYFSTLFPEPVQGSEEGLMDLIINVEEGRTTDVQFGLTFSGSSDPDDFPISGLLSVTDRNFFGYGSQVKAEVSASVTTQNLSLSYAQRWLKDIPLSWGADFNLSHSKRHAAINNGVTGPVFYGNESEAFPDGFYDYDSYVKASKIPADEFLMEYQQWYISLGLSATYRWNFKPGTFGTGGGIRTGIINNTYDDMIRPFDPVIRERNGEWTPVNSIWTVIFLDDRDLSYDPSSGYYGSQRFSFHGFFPVELEHYIRSDTKTEVFFTLIDIPGDKWSFKTILALHSGLSFILPQFGEDDPIIEDANKLYIDGMFIGRGWYDERMTRGFALWENWAELRFPLFPGILAFDLFFDADVVKDTPKNFFNNLSISDWRFSLGGGFRFTIAQFPFRFLLAKRFKIVDGRVEWQSGSMFRNADRPNSGLDFVVSFAVPTN